MITKTKEATSLATHIKNATLIICSVLILTVFWIYLFSSALIIEQKSYTTEEYLTQPLINFSLLEKSGTTVASKGLISGLSATFEGTKIGWKSIYTTNPDFPKSLTGIIGYWKLDNSLTDSSGKNNQLVAQGGISCSGDFGFLNNGCAFGEYGQYLEIKNINKTLNPKSGTISVWAYPTGNASNSYIIQGNTPDSDRYYIQWTNGRIRIVRGTQNPNIQNSSVATINLLENTELNNWYHIVMSWDESSIYGYINGMKMHDAKIDYFSPSYSTNTKFRIGNQQSSSSTDNRSFPGQIDEIAFFNRKLTDNEIKQLFKEASDTTNPIPNSNKYLSFETSGSSAYGRLRINNHSEIQKLNIKDIFTIEADIYLKEYPTDANQPYTVYTDSSVLSNGNGLTVFPNGLLGVYANTGNTRSIFRSGQVPLNEWVTVKGSFNSKTNEMSVSINEKDFVTTNPDKKTGITKSFTRPMIGMSGTWYNAFKGYIKNVKLWNTSILNGQYSYGLAEITKAGFDNPQKILTPSNFTYIQLSFFSKHQSRK
ncbi:MAG: hypothetical protein BWY53_00664 [Parcubacteria group bacterium ADurb.Bin326]|nr:MAG: hypothetical protein BWY53_00664 [Parcubacteria group bacterium ADurb.Bin326]